MPMPPPPLLPPASLLADPEAAAREHAMKMKIRSLRSQVCKLKARVRELKQEQKASKKGGNMESLIKQLEKLLPSKTTAFVSTQMRMSQRKANGCRWTTEDKAFFLALLRASPKCYSLLFNVLSMPSIRTLQKYQNSSEFIQPKSEELTIKSEPP